MPLRQRIHRQGGPAERNLEVGSHPAAGSLAAVGTPAAGSRLVAVGSLPAAGSLLVAVGSPVAGGTRTLLAAGSRRFAQEGIPFAVDSRTMPEGIQLVAAGDSPVQGDSPVVDTQAARVDTRVAGLADSPVREGTRLAEPRTLAVGDSQRVVPRSPPVERQVSVPVSVSGAVVAVHALSVPQTSVPGLTLRPGPCRSPLPSDESEVRHRCTRLPSSAGAKVPPFGLLRGTTNRASPCRSKCL